MDVFLPIYWTDYTILYCIMLPQQSAVLPMIWNTSLFNRHLCSVIAAGVSNLGSAAPPNGTAEFYAVTAIPVHNNRIVMSMLSTTPNMWSTTPRGFRWLTFSITNMYTLRASEISHDVNAATELGLAESGQQRQAAIKLINLINHWLTIISHYQPSWRKHCH